MSRRTAALVVPLVAAASVALIAGAAPVAAAGYEDRGICVVMDDPKTEVQEKVCVFAG